MVIWSVTLVSFILDLLCIKLRSQSLLRNSNKMTVELVQAYQSLKLVTEVYFGFASHLMSGGTVASLLVSSVSLYFACGSNGPIHERLAFLTIFVIIGLFVAFMLDRLGKLQTSSASLLVTWNSECFSQPRTGRKSWQITRRRLRNCPIKVLFSFTYVCNETSFLVYWDTIIDRTIFLLCTFPFQ